MTDDQRTGLPTDESESGAESHPRGTLFLMLLFLIAIAAMWSYMYLILLERG